MILSNLSLCWGSLDGEGFSTFLSSAADAGFKSITLNTALYLEAKSTGLSDRDISQALHDHDLKVSDIDPLFNWLPSAVTLPGDNAISICTQATSDDVFHLAHLAGTDLVNAPLGLASPDSEQEIVDCFAALCEKAAQEDLRVSLEFMPFNQVSNLETAARIVKQAGCENGGIMFDCWHHHRGGGQPDDILDVPGEYFFAMQLDDALEQPMDDIMEETLNYRLLPGNGCIDLVQTLRNLKTVGAEVIYDVEVFNNELMSLGASDRARLMFESANSVVTQL
jgi:sugar phosphate isomerase/epimerase